MLPELDFFILLSSISGIVGNPGQSNYAAGCTFQDALARYRSKRGQKAISIDLGVMRSIGVVAESESLQRHFEEVQGFAHLEEQDLILLMDVCCNPTRPVATSQIIMGLVTPADLLARSSEPTEMMQQPPSSRPPEDPSPIVPASKQEAFLLTAADQAPGSRDERLARVIRSKYGREIYLLY